MGYIVYPLPLKRVKTDIQGEFVWVQIAMISKQDIRWLLQPSFYTACVSQ